VTRQANALSRLTKYETVLIIFFMLTLPFSNPWVRGDGVGYYAFARSLLIQHRLDFTRDWLNSNPSFRMERIDAAGTIRPEQYTATGHLDNHFSVGPAILWAPFLVVAHLGVLAFDRLGGHVPANGYSKPYVIAMALGTAFYGFLALFIAFRLAREYVPERWAFVASLGIWLGSSLPVYMYFNPSWSHAQSAFVVAVFVWYWHHTRKSRTWAQWSILGAMGGLMMDVYYLNVVLFLLPLLEILARRRRKHPDSEIEPLGKLALKATVFFGVVLATFLPTLIAKKIIYGSYFNFGYTERWYWDSPAFFKVCFSSNHGLFSWTPILILAVAGLFLLRRYDREMALYSIMVFVGYLYLVGCYQNWHGMSSFGNRFFISLTALFVVGLAAFLDALARAWRSRSGRAFAIGAMALLVLWNMGLIFQWGTHLIPARGPIPWREAAYNQVAVVPLKAESVVESYLMRRHNLMNRIEQEDVNQLKSNPSEGTE